MSDELPNCWDILKCKRQAGGKKVSELGECVVSKDGMGHSCWAVAGTLCGGEIQGTIAMKIGYCTSCEVHKAYNRSMGKKGKLVSLTCPEENARYNKIILENRDCYEAELSGE